MAGPFDAVHEQIEKDFGSRESTSPESNQESQHASEPQTDAAQKAPLNQESKSRQEVAEEIAELEKIEKFKFQGKEYTPKELGEILKQKQEAQKAYTQNQQALADARKSLEATSSERKYYDNLVTDLEKVRQNPSLAQEFIQVYPQKFHSYLNKILTSNSQGQNQQGQQQPHVNVELMSRLQQLESENNQAKVANAEIQIERDLTSTLKDFKYASKKEVLADVFEFYNQSQPDPVTGMKPPITPEIWKKAAEASHNSRREEFVRYQKELQQEQKQVNAKSRDVSAGGGTAGQAPKKFKAFSREHNEFVRNSVSGKA